MRIPFTHLRISFNSIIRVFNWLVVIAYAIGIAIHERFPEAIAWLTPGVKTAVALAVFALMADRILRVHSVVCESPLSIHKTRESAYKELVQLVAKYSPKRVDLIQFSGKTAVDLIKTIAALDRPVQVRLFLVSPDQAAGFDRDIESAVGWHIGRINDTLAEASIAHQQHPTCEIKAYHYTSPAGPSVVVIDSWIASLGWYHCFSDASQSGIMRVRGHAAPAVNVTDARSPLLWFAQEQIRNIEKTATAAQLPAIPAVGQL
ncbi:MAG: hypothetical protein WAQ52_01675 [Terriglobales bacterium]